MLRYKLRTLLIVLALGPLVLAAGWVKCEAWREQFQREQERALDDDRVSFDSSIVWAAFKKESELKSRLQRAAHFQRFAMLCCGVMFFLVLAKTALRRIRHPRKPPASPPNHALPAADCNT